MSEDTVLVGLMMLSGWLIDRWRDEPKQVVEVIEMLGPPSPLQPAKTRNTPERDTDEFQSKRHRLANARAQEIVNASSGYKDCEQLRLGWLRDEDEDFYLLVMAEMPKFSRHWK